MPTFDRVIQILGFLLGLLVLFEYFRKQTLEASLFVILLIVITGFIVYRHIEQNRPLFTILEAEKRLQFLTGLPENNALLSYTISARANYTGLTEYWFRNITADGRIQNFKVDGQPVAAQMKGGTHEFCKAFARPLKKGETKKITASFELIESYPSPREGITHVAITETKRLKIAVDFHHTRLGRDCKCFLGRGGGIEKELPTPKSLSSGSTVEIELDKLQTGGYYTLEWIW